MAHQPFRHARIVNGFTLLEVVIVGTILISLLAVLLFLITPRRHRGAPSTRLVCASNLRGIGTSCKIYANENSDAWPSPAFDETMIGNIDYTVSAGSGQGSRRSPNRRQSSTSGAGGARQLSTTRAFWMLVRSGDATPSQFICPQSGNTAETNEDIDLYYDFGSPANVSFGFQVPFGPSSTRAHERRDNQMILAADKGPYSSANVAVPPIELGVDAAPREWSAFNSRNHKGEGQNALFADGHAEFVRMPVVGIDGDNIYTVALDTWNPVSRVVGESPWANSAPPREPSGSSEVFLSGTDSVIFP